ncbi:SspB family protein [Brevirhabdus sp.]|uniref:SspB family protein n=1 Tax=Brevirhabdus sp. TaxID=2004514 RepID=UPI004059E14C
MSRQIDYGNLMHRAMRRLISDVLTDVGRNGLPGEHHFFITYDTTHPRVGMTEWLKERYPEEITIVIQHWFEDLIVEDEGFHVTLNFGDQPVALYVPFDSMQTFVDPSVEFGLRFDRQSDARTDEDDDLHIVEIDDDDDEDDEAHSPSEKEAEIVSLDSFRK